MRIKPFRRPSHSTAVAYLALFVALGGTGAYAAAEIGASDIEDDAVRSRHVKDGQIETEDLAGKAVTEDVLGSDSVGGGKIRFDAVGSSELRYRAVGLNEINKLPHGRAVQTTGQEFADQTQEDVELDELEFGSRINLTDGEVTVERAGVYAVSAEVEWEANGSGLRGLSVARNGIAIAVNDNTQAAPGNQGDTIHGASGLVELQPGDRVGLSAVQASGGDLSTNPVGGSAVELSLHYVSRLGG